MKLAAASVLFVALTSTASSSEVTSGIANCNEYCENAYRFQVNIDTCKRVLSCPRRGLRGKAVKSSARIIAAKSSAGIIAAAVEEPPQELNTMLEVAEDKPVAPLLDPDTPIYNISEMQSSLDAHRNIWQQTVGQGNRYTMKLARFCYCFGTYRGPFNIQVVNGAVDSATYEDGTEVNDDILSGLPTVEGVMDRIQDGLNRGYVELNVMYDNMGYPSEFFSDSSRLIADDEITYKISDVEVTSP